MMLSEELNDKLQKFIDNYNKQIFDKIDKQIELSNQYCDLQCYQDKLKSFERTELLEKEIDHLRENKQNAIQQWFNETINITKVDTEIGDFTILYENKNTEIVNKEEKIKELEKLIEQKKKTLSNKNFLEKAPKEIIEKEKKLLKQYERQIKKL